MAVAAMAELVLASGRPTPEFVNSPEPPYLDFAFPVSSAITAVLFMERSSANRTAVSFWRKATLPALPSQFTTA